MEQERQEIQERVIGLANREKAIRRKEEDLKAMEREAAAVQEDHAKREAQVVCCVIASCASIFVANTLCHAAVITVWLMITKIRENEAKSAEVKKDAERTVEAAVNWEKHRAKEEAALQVELRPLCLTRAGSGLASCCLTFIALKELIAESRKAADESTKASTTSKAERGKLEAARKALARTEVRQR